MCIFGPVLSNLKLNNFALHISAASVKHKFQKSGNAGRAWAPSKFSKNFESYGWNATKVVGTYGGPLQDTVASDIYCLETPSYCCKWHILSWNCNYYKFLWYVQLYKQLLRLGNCLTDAAYFYQKMGAGHCICWQNIVFLHLHFVPLNYTNCLPNLCLSS